MFKVNQYFDGKVTSIAFAGEELPATVGVMAPGEYEFGTSQHEVLTIVSGALTVLLRVKASGKPLAVVNHSQWRPDKNSSCR